jgi:pimeloyl-ACP methyl ester carboxylesterase
VGWSLGADLSLVAAARSAAVAAVAPIEPVMPRLLNEQEYAAVGTAVARMGELGAAGKLAAAARAFATWPFQQGEIAVAEEAGYFEAAGRYVPGILNFFQQQQASQGNAADVPAADDPAVLGAISAPALVLHGSGTKPFFIASARHTVEHVADARLHEIPGAGHATPLTHPKALAEALTGFLVSARQPA